ncbi:MAG: carbohydrate ABC transporter permease [Lachnospiraceae bacterium]|jgi:putative aldouronate transport system permease protein|nr:carbohydrate ABC transporter permease [Lachnospiraceae bacterium]
MKKNKTTPFDVFLIIFLGAICIICVLPFIHLLAVSFSDNAAVSAGKVGFLPVDFTLASYEYVIKGAKFFRAMGISLIRVALGTLLNLALMVLTAYPLARDELRFRKAYVIFFVITMLFSGGMIPTYLLVSKLGLKNNILALILPGALPVYNMIILMNFIRGLPKELEEAAWIDGATPFQTLTMVIFPLLGPSLATVGLFQMVFHWNDWFSGLIYMSNPNLYPLQTYLQTLLVNFEQLLQSSGNGADITAILSKMNARTGRAAQLFLGALPIMMVYPFLQKYFTKGLTLGSVKG